MKMKIMRHVLALTLFATATLSPANVSKWVEDNRAAILVSYFDLLAIPNVAGDIINIRRNADHIMKMMAARGLAPRLLELDDPSSPPAIYGEWLVPGAKRTLILYAHYDGQPITPEDWKSGQPFLPILRSARLDKGGEVLPLPSTGQAIDPEWRIYARGASDDKAGVMAILFAIEALKAEGKRPGFNLKIFFDGEEEVGSPHLASIMDTNRALLGSDGWIIFDGPAHPSGAAQVVLGVRGVASAEITVYGPARPLHSGHYGNWVPNPAMMLSKLLASMKDERGRVTITGFYDDVTPLTDAERAAIAEVPSADDQQRAELGLGWTEGSGRPLVELLHEPSLNIDGIRSADVGDRSRNVIPATATAALDLRLVKGNDHVRQLDRLVRHIEAQGYHVVDHEPAMEERLRWPKIALIRRGAGYNAERTPLDAPLARSVTAAVRSVGPAVVLPSLGGSLPLYVLREVLGAQSVTVSLANHDNNQHAEDENIRLGSFWNEIAVVAAVMRMR
jgi:acetylornithine deacetylase/succinyl-diaminopimelate desuccinylase-like protein